MAKVFPEQRTLSENASSKAVTKASQSSLVEEFIVDLPVIST